MSGMTAHTPGEWIARKGSTTGAEVVGKKPRGGEYIIGRFGGKDREANAQLSAAAPDMLMALKYARDELGKHKPTSAGIDAFKQCEAAIAKATSPEAR